MYLIPKRIINYHRASKYGSRSQSSALVLGGTAFLLSPTYFNSHGNSIGFFLSQLGVEIAFPRLPMSVCRSALLPDRRSQITIYLTSTKKPKPCIPRSSSVTASIRCAIAAILTNTCQICVGLASYNARPSMQRGFIHTPTVLLYLYHMVDSCFKVRVRNMLLQLCILVVTCAGNH